MAMDLQIDDSEKLLWSDILHYHWLASRAHDKWDYNSAVRSMVMVGWVVVELVMGRMSGCVKLGYSFRKNLDEHLNSKQIAPIDWSSGWGKEMSDFLAHRKKIVHLAGKSDIKDFFYKNSDHGKRLAQLRSILAGISKHLGYTESWWNDAQAEDYKAARFGSALMSFGLAGYSPETGHEIGFVRSGRDVLWGEVPPEKSREKYEEMKCALSGPVSKTFIRCGGQEIYSEEFFSRGV